MFVSMISLGILCIGYYLIIVLYAGITVDFAWIWLLGAALTFSGSGALYYGKIHPEFWPGWLKYAAAGCIIIGLLLFTVICSGVICGMTWNGSDNLDYVVVLGAQVNGTVPSRALRKRLDKAYEYAMKNSETMLVLSGGQGGGEDITEAQCMKEFLEERGLPKERMILEEKSTNTMENLKFSNELSGCADKKTGIISNNFHIYRALKLAKKMGYIYAEGIAAPSDPILQVHYVVREVFALVKEVVKGNIGL